MTTTWEERLATIKSAGAVSVTIEFHDEDGSLLTDDESDRAAPLLTLAAEASQKLAYNMIKGVLKYKTEGRPPREWVEFAIDDAADTLNYMYLIKSAMDAETS